ncbi:MAG: hypothetical protein K2X62_02190 [Beijerinckiaceae bacterium]|nr:hypothetical protein [Beijerinckiaceae bacterium]
MAGALAALGIAATVAVSATPASADWRGHRGGWGGHHRGWGGPVAAGVIGGLALGAIAGNRYYGPSYAQPVYGGDCYRQDRPTYDRWGRFIGYRGVTICD